MADSVSFNIDADAVIASFDDARLKIPRTTMYALRRVGANARRVSRAAAPVYKGPPRVGVIKGELRAAIKTSRNIQNRAGILVLELGPFGGGKSTSKGSRIKAKYASERQGALTSSKPYKARTAARTVKSGTRTGGLYGVSLYRRKQEAKYGFMEKGRAVAEATATAEFEKAVEEMLAKYK